MRKDLLSRLEALEAAVNPVGIDWGAYYDFGLMADLSVPGPGMTEEDMKEKYVQEHGTREEYIVRREAQWREWYPSKFNRPEPEKK